jgi:hypothetical protein
MQTKVGARASGLINWQPTMNMMESTIVQNGALYFAQHRHPERDRKHRRLRQTVVDKVRQEFTIIGARAAEYLEQWSSYRPVTSK